MLVRLYGNQETAIQYKKARIDRQDTANGRAPPNKKAKQRQVRAQAGQIAQRPFVSRSRQRQEAAHKGRKARKPATLAGLHSVRAQAVRRRPCCSSRPGWKKREIQDIFGAALSAIPSLRTSPLSLSASFSAAEHTWVYTLVAMAQQGDHSRRRANRSRALPPCERAAATPLPAWRRAACDELTTVKIMIRTGALK